MEIKTSLQQGVVLLIASQDELNFLAELEDGVEADCLHIDEPYVAFKDSDDVIRLLALSLIDDSYPMEFDKPRKFAPWYKRNNV